MGENSFSHSTHPSAKTLEKIILSQLWKEHNLLSFFYLEEEINSSREFLRKGYR